MSELPPPSFPPPPSSEGRSSPRAPLPDPAPFGAGPGATGRRRRPLVAGFGLLVVVAIAGVVVARSWGGDEAADGTALEFRERWSVRVPGLAGRDEFEPTWIVSSEDDVVVFNTAADDELAAVVALDPANGDELWSFELPVGLSGGLAVTRVDDVVLIASAASDRGADDDGQDDSFEIDRSSELRAVDARTGEVLWTQDDLQPTPAFVPVGGAVLLGLAEPGAGDEMVQRLSARDLTSGDELWDRESSGRVMPVTVRSNGVVLLDSSDGSARYVGLAPDGEERWTWDADPSFAQFDWWPAQAADVIPLIDGQQVVGVDLESGERTWSADLTAVGQPEERQLFVMPDAGVAVGCEEGSGERSTVDLDVIDLSSGDVAWTSTVEGSNPAYLGLVGAAALTTEESLGASGCVGSTEFGALRGATARSLEDGRDLWTIPADDDTAGFVVDYAERAPWTSPSVSSVSLLQSNRSGDRLVDLTTGETIVDIPRADGFPVGGLGRVDGNVIGVQPGADPADDETTLFDQLDPDRSLQLPPLSRPIGGADGVLYLRSGSRVVAVE